MQGTVEEQLIKQVLQEAEEFGDKESGEEVSPPILLMLKPPQKPPLIWAKTPARRLSEYRLRTRRSTRSRAGRKCAGGVPHPDYEEKIRSIQNAPLRTRSRMFRRCRVSLT